MRLGASLSLRAFVSGYIYVRARVGSAKLSRACRRRNRWGLVFFDPLYRVRFADFLRERSFLIGCSPVDDAFVEISTATEF